MRFYTISCLQSYKNKIQWNENEWQFTNDTKRWTVSPSVFVVPFCITLQSTARSARNILVGGWIGCIGSNDRKKCFLIVTGNHLMVYCSFCCFSLGTLWRRNFTWLKMIAKFRELMESVISWIFSPFIDRKQNFVVFVFSLLQQVEVWHCEWHWTSISNWFHCVKVFIHGGGSLKEFKMGSFREYESVIWCKWSGQP